MLKGKGYFVAGALLMAHAVAMGAMGAHALKTVLDSSGLESYNTAVRYELIHGMGLLLIQSFGDRLNGKWKSYSSLFMLTGIFLFSFSIYLLSLREILHLGESIGFLGPITPIGGIALIFSWISLAIAGVRTM